MSAPLANATGEVSGGSSGLTAIVGAGLAGLAAALELEERGEDFVIFDRADRAGGVVSSVRREGYLLERGPRTVPSVAPVLGRLIEASGLTQRVQLSDPAAARRYIWNAGRLHAVPTSLGELLRTSLLSPAGRLRLLGDLFIRPGGAPDETFADFVTRRFGAEACARLADPVCAGVFATRPERLGVEAFARAAVLEQEHGSILRGMSRLGRARRKVGEAEAGLLSFPEGLEELPAALAARFSAQLRLGVKVHSVRRVTAGEAAGGAERSGRPAPKFRLDWSSDAGGSSSQQATFVDRVVVATPSGPAAEILSGLAPGVAETLEGIRQVPLAVLALGYPRDSIKHRLDGFGLLRCSAAPLPTGSSVLGVLFSSSIFAGRAPEGMALLEVMVGGDRDPEALACSDAALYERAQQACEEALGTSGEPSFRHLTRWTPILPQYAPGHAQRISGAREALQSIGPIVLAGNYLDGVGVEAAAASGIAAVASLL